MSAYICGQETYQTIIDAIFSEDEWHRLRGKELIDLLRGQPDLEDGTRSHMPKGVHQALYDMNEEAFCHRYPGDNGERTRYPEDIEGGFEPLPRYLDFPPHLTRAQLIQAFKSVGCLIYQCSEGDVTKTPLYKALRDFEADLARELVKGSGEYDAAEWG